MSAVVLLIVLIVLIGVGGLGLKKYKPEVVNNAIFYIQNKFKSSKLVDVSFKDTKKAENIKKDTLSLTLPLVNLKTDIIPKITTSVVGKQATLIVDKALSVKAQETLKQAPKIVVQTAKGPISVTLYMFNQILNNIKKALEKLRNTIGKYPISDQPVAAKLVKEADKDLAKIVKLTTEKKSGEEVKKAEIHTQVSAIRKTIQDHVQVDETEVPFYELLIELELKIDNLLHCPMVYYPIYDLRNVDKSIELLSDMAVFKNKVFNQSRPIGDTLPSFYEDLTNLEQLPVKPLQYAGKSVREDVNTEFNMSGPRVTKNKIPVLSEPFRSYYMQEKADVNYYDY